MLSGAVRLPAFAGTMEEEYAPKQPEDDWNPLFVEALHRQPVYRISVGSFSV